MQNNFLIRICSCLAGCVLLAACRPELEIPREPTGYQSIDRDQINVRTLFPLLEQSSLNNEVTIEFDFKLDQGVVLIDQENPIQLDFKVKRLTDTDKKLAYGFAYSPEGTQLMMTGQDQFRVFHPSPQFNRSNPLKIFVIFRDLNTCIDELSEEDCSMSDPNSRYEVKNQYDRILRLNVDRRPTDSITQ